MALRTKNTSVHRVVCVLACLSVLGCNKEPAKVPKKVKRRADKIVPVPNHSPEMMSGPGEARYVLQKGKMQARLNGALHEFPAFPRGTNAALSKPEHGLKWFKVRGLKDAKGGPSLEVFVDHVDLAKLAYPYTIKLAKTEKGEPRLRIRYAQGEGKRWETNPEADQADRTSLTIDSFDGQIVKGHFNAFVEPSTGGSALEIKDGSFEIAPRLVGALAPAKKGTPPPAEKAAAVPTPAPKVP